MSSENRPGNRVADHCPRHGDFIGLLGGCPVCEGVQRPVRPKMTKCEYARRRAAGLDPDDDDWYGE